MLSLFLFILRTQTHTHTHTHAHTPNRLEKRESDVSAGPLVKATIAPTVSRTATHCAQSAACKLYNGVAWGRWALAWHIASWKPGARAELGNPHHILHRLFFAVQVVLAQC